MVLNLLCPGGVSAENVLLINEFLAHPSTGNKEWIEIYNPDKIDLSKYFIDDDLDFSSDVGSSAKKSLAVLIATDSAYPYIELSSFLNDGGDYVVLFSPDGRILDQYQYTKDSGVDVSLGRFPDGADYWDILLSTTKGAQNSQPIPTNTPTPMPTDTPEPTDTPAPASNAATATPTPTPTPKPTPKPASNTAAATSSSIMKTGDVLSESSGSSEINQKPEKTEVLSTKNNNIIPIALILVGIVFLVACAIVFFYPYIVKFKNKSNNE